MGIKNRLFIALRPVASLRLLPRIAFLLNTVLPLTSFTFPTGIMIPFFTASCTLFMSESLPGIMIAGTRMVLGMLEAKMTFFLRSPMSFILSLFSVFFNSSSSSLIRDSRFSGVAFFPARSEKIILRRSNLFSSHSLMREDNFLGSSSRDMNSRCLMFSDISRALSPIVST